jgi:TRAP-type C4-dicarboxylate transport system substrate-binding protein
LDDGVVDWDVYPFGVYLGANDKVVGQKYLTLTRHVYSALVFVGSKAFFDKLPPADQQAFMAAAAQASTFGRNYVRSNEAKQLAALEAAGMQVVTNPDLAAFRAKTEPVYASLTGDTKKIVDEIRKSEK